MAIVNLSLDTNTRQVALVIDGALKPMAEVHLAYFFDMDGEKIIRFSYSMEIANEDGLMERRVFELPDEVDSSGLATDSEGMTSRKDVSSAEVAEDIKDYMKHK